VLRRLKSFGHGTLAEADGAALSVLGTQFDVVAAGSATGRIAMIEEAAQ
jgi:hypothetical protein